MPKNVVCKKCNNLVNDWCEKVIDSPDQDMQRDCQYFCEKTRADKIRAMSDEEITEFVCRNGINTLCDIICGGECNAIASFKKSGDEACKEIVMKWLQQPSEVEE